MVGRLFPEIWIPEILIKHSGDLKSRKILNLKKSSREIFELLRLGSETTSSVHAQSSLSALPRCAATSGMMQELARAFPIASNRPRSLLRFLSLVHSCSLLRSAESLKRDGVNALPSHDQGRG